MKSIFKKFGSTRIKEKVEKKTKFSVFNEASTLVLRIRKLTPETSRHQRVYAQHASEDEGDVTGASGSSYPRQQNNK